MAGELQANHLPSIPQIAGCEIFLTCKLGWERIHHYQQFILFFFALVLSWQDFLLDHHFLYCPTLNLHMILTFPISVQDLFFGQDSEQVLFSNRILNQPCTCTETWVGPVLCRIQNKLRLLLDFEPALFLYRILTTGSAQFLGRIRKPPCFFAGFWTNPDSVLDSEPALILC